MSATRRFRAGDTFSIPPMDYRMEYGKKGSGDLRLDWRYHDSAGRISPWRPVELDHVALIVDAIADNENYLYPPRLPLAVDMSGGSSGRRSGTAGTRHAMSCTVSGCRRTNAPSPHERVWPSPLHKGDGQEGNPPPTIQER